MRKNNIRTILVIASVILLIFTLSACANTDSDVEVTKVIVKAQVELLEGETEQLTVGIDPFNATDKSVTYQTSNSGVATVSDSGLITAVAIGNATITVTATNGVNATVNVSVVKNAEGIDFNIVENNQIFKNDKKDTYDVVVASNTTADEKYFIVNPNASVLPVEASQNIEYKSSNEKLAFVQNGQIYIVCPKEIATYSMSDGAKQVKITMTAKKKKVSANEDKEIKRDIIINIHPYLSSDLKLNLNEGYDYDSANKQFTNIGNDYTYNMQKNIVNVLYSCYVKTNKPVDKLCNGNIYTPNIEVSIKVDGTVKSNIEYKITEFGDLYILVESGAVGSTSKYEVTIKDTITGQQYVQQFDVKTIQ